MKANDCVRPAAIGWRKWNTLPAGAGRKMVFGLVWLAAVAGALLYAPADFLQPENMKALANEAGIFGPLVFIGLYAAGVCLFLPAMAFTALGAVLFGAAKGFVYSTIGAMCGASGAFLAGRYLGRDFTATLPGDRFRRYARKIGENGFAVTMYMRLVNMPFTPLSFGLGLTRITFRQFFWGTLLGKTAGCIAITVFFARLPDLMAGGRWQQLLHPEYLFALLFFAGSFFIPTLVKNSRIGIMLNERAGGERTG